MKIKDIDEFRNIVICALRYALGRRTYITSSTAEFIEQYPEIIDSRMKSVMLEDLKRYFDMRNNNFIKDDRCDYETWLELNSWLEKIEI